MTSVLRLLTAGLLVCLVSPRLVQAGGDLGLAPYEIGEKLFAKKHYATALKYYRKALEQGDVRAGDAVQRVTAIQERPARKPTRSPDKRLKQKATRSPDKRLKQKATQSPGERLTRNPALSPELLERGKSLFDKGMYREAEQVLLQAASADKSRPEVHFYLGEVYTQLEDYGKAKSEYDKAKNLY